jgi:hypothetical protein
MAERIELQKTNVEEGRKTFEAIDIANSERQAKAAEQLRLAD